MKNVGRRHRGAGARNKARPRTCALAAISSTDPPVAWRFELAGWRELIRRQTKSG